MADTGSTRRATLIESLGVYLPPREVRTGDLMRGCHVQTGFPLERMSGITSRHVAGDTEFAIDLAEQAITRCLATSRYGPGDVEILICANVARCDGPPLWISQEPSTALQLRQRFGFDRAMVFDVASACAGMFTAIAMVDTLIRQGVIDCGIVASGEYISHLGETAQKEIVEVLDQRLACLTLGDAGAAVMLAASDDLGRGFAALDLTTLSAYSGYCVGAPTTAPHGGAIMFTDALKLTDAATKNGAIHARKTMERAGWAPESFRHLIMHQTSSTALISAMREINRLVGRRVCHPGNTIDNLARRGNTASTTHFVALADAIASGRIRSGDRVVFAISGSGLTVGTGLYAMDDLPERLAAPINGNANGARPGRTPIPRIRRHGPAAPVRIESIGLVPAPATRREDTLTLLERAATDCFQRSSVGPGDLGLLMYAGVYRTGFVAEPAIASLLAGKLGINPTLAGNGGRETLACDISNGAVGFLNACYLATEMIRAGRIESAMIVTSDIENNAEVFPDQLLGIEETAAAVILTHCPAAGTGFGPFHFSAFTEHAGAFTSRCSNRAATTCLVVTRDPELERHYVDGIVATVAEFLAAEEIALEQIARIIPPQISTGFVTGLSHAVGIPRERMVDVTVGRKDLLTSSVPFALRALADGGSVRPGEIGLIITAGSGVQVGCAIYHF